MIGSLVEVEWVDVTHRDDLTLTEAKRLKPAKAVSRGKLLVNNNRVVVVAGTEFPGDNSEPTEYRDVSCIPKVLVSKISKVRKEA